MIKTPTKPTKIAIHVFKDTFSLNIIADKATTKTGVRYGIDKDLFTRGGYLNSHVAGAVTQAASLVTRSKTPGYPS